METKLCPKCNTSLAASAKFCSECGSKFGSISKVSLSGKQRLALLVLIIGLLVLSYFGQNWFIGKKPSGTHSPNMEAAKTNIDPNMSTEELLAQAQANIEKLSEAENPDSSIILESVDLLSKVLEREPQNDWALLQMAEIAFAQRIFDKSAEFYERYLKIVPEDNVIRARYASALTFFGKTDQAIKELESIIAKDPKNFQALAFLAIASHQAGFEEKSKENLKKALELAPNEEAKVRLEKFAKSMQEQPVASGQTTQSAPTNQSTSQFASLDNYLKSHPIAASKYQGMVVDGDQIKLSFAEFPMDKMPPMVKDKFTTNLINEANKDSAGKNYHLVLLDKVTGNEMWKGAVN